LKEDFPVKGKHLFVGIALFVLIVSLVGCEEPTVPVPASPEEYCDAGWLDLQDNEYTSAQENFNEALAVDPGYPNGWNGLGWSALSRDDLDGAFVNFAYGKQTVGDPLDQDSTVYRNLFFRFYMDAFVGAAMTNYLAQDYSMAILDFEQAIDYDTDSENGDAPFDWNYFNWYMKDGDTYTLATWHARLFCALAYIKDSTLSDDDALDGAEEHINACRVRNGDSGDFNAGDRADVNDEVNRLLNMDPPAPDMLDYPGDYPY
jgi:tetratricopeptide (TPR) repeat protein